MTPRLTDLMIFGLTRPGLVVGTFLVVMVGGAVLEVALREKCGVCGERVRVPLAAHWQVDHAGETL